jgi:hypothetical protein
MAVLISPAFLDSAFLDAALRALDDNGFISDRHAFSPGREVLQIHGAAIEDQLSLCGFVGCLKTCFMLHESAGFIYVLYDRTRYVDHNDACSAVIKWLDKSLGIVPRQWP